MKINRTTLNHALALGGFLIVLFQSMFMAFERYQLAIVIAGFMVNQVGVWGLGAKLLPERRVYLKLRAEVDSFIGLVRQLNAQAVRGETTAVETTRSSMKQSVDRMVSCAAEREPES
jgi:hypothetical protein